MLVLSRSVGEGVLIGDGIYVVILARKGNRVRIGITAPRSVRVLRGELSGSTDESVNSGGDGMLVLSRKVNESIQIGDTVTIKVLKVAGKVKLGVQAPTDVRILRSELSEAA